MAVALASRLARLEMTIRQADPDPVRAYLRAQFAGPQFAGHRAAIVRALMGPQPSYTFTAADGACYIIWGGQPGRYGGMTPYAKVIRRTRTVPSQLPDHLRPPTVMHISAETDRALRGLLPPDFAPPAVQQVPPAWAAAFTDEPPAAAPPIEQATPTPPAVAPADDDPPAWDAAGDGLWDATDDESSEGEESER